MTAPVSTNFFKCLLLIWGPATLLATAFSLINTAFALFCFANTSVLVAYLLASLKSGDWFGYPASSPKSILAMFITLAVCVIISCFGITLVLEDFLG